MILLSSVVVAVAALAPPSTFLQVVFVPDAATAPAVVVVAHDVGDAHTLRWLVASVADTGAGPAAARAGLVQGRGSSSSLLLPRAPAGASIIEREGGVVVTVDDAGAWQAPFAALPRSKAQGPAVADERALRLVVTGWAPGAPAFLVGSRVRIAGRAVMLRERTEVVAAVALPDRLLLATPSSVASFEGCGRTLPQALSAPEELLRLARPEAGAPSCGQGLWLVPVLGTRMDPKRDVPAQGVVVVLDGAR